MKNEEFRRLGSEIVLILVFLDREILTATLIPFVSVCGCQMIVYYLPACVRVCVYERAHIHIPFIAAHSVTVT